MPFYGNGDFVRLSEREEEPQESVNTLFRDGFHDDVARLVHSPSFRRLVRKRQLLPNEHSDFVRNRLTHSNEVAQIATSIGHHLNTLLVSEGNPDFRISSDVLIFAGLAHDIGHPPFGHLGEIALNEKMLDAGGFEGNAQTIRVISKLERRLTAHDTAEGGDVYNSVLGKFGLNPTFRCLASTLKYNEPIPIRGFDKLRLERKEREIERGHRRLEVAKLVSELEEFERLPDLPNRRRQKEEVLRDINKLSSWEDGGEHPEPKLSKGYYWEDIPMIERMFSSVFGEDFTPTELTQSVECQIMDFADDIAYSIYDLEDCLKTGVVTAETLMSLGYEFLCKIAADVVEKVHKSHVRGKILDTYGKRLSVDDLENLITPDFLSQYLFETLVVLFDENDEGVLEEDEDVIDRKRTVSPRELRKFGRLLRAARGLSKDGRIRRKLTDFYILRCCQSAQIELNTKVPAASMVRYPLSTHIRIELLKRLNYHLVIKSDLIQSGELRGEEIVRSVFDALYLPCDEFKLTSQELTGYHLLPEDVREVVDTVYEETETEILEIRYHLSKQEEVFHNVVRNHPDMRAFSVRRMLNIKNYEFRYSLAISLYEDFLRGGQRYSEMHQVLTTRRTAIKRIVCDFIAGMTDRGVFEFYSRLKLKDGRIVFEEFSL